MRITILVSFIIIIVFWGNAYSQQSPKSIQVGSDYMNSAKPYTRWWWFSGEIEEETIRYQLDWAKKNNFGGVEVAFVYPLLNAKPGPKWLSPEWSAKCVYAKQYADKIGLGCDFTFGTVWPFGGTIVSEEDASKVFGGLSTQRMEKSWEMNYEPKPSYILNHLDSNAFNRYAEKVGGALKDALKGKPCAIFCDSWEVETENIWTEGFDKAFIKKFNYDISPFMPDINKHPDERFDYRKLVAMYVLNQFYIPFNKEAHRLNTLSRVQCHGSPSDLIESYSAVDVPETEAILYEPSFSVIPASAAALSSKKIVSSESFTCLYGWKAWRGPSPYEKKEQVADMKLVADALFANGVNQIVWHGMPYNPKGGNNEFYATVHVGPDSYFADEIPAFNKYMEKVSEAMRQGRTYSDVAVYFPLEDIWMADTLDSESKNVGVGIKHVKTPQELKQYHPLWISGSFLKDCVFEHGKLIYSSPSFSTSREGAKGINTNSTPAFSTSREGAKGIVKSTPKNDNSQLAFSLLYIDSKYVDYDNILQILRLAKLGLPVCFKKKPVQPGKIKAENYKKIVAELFSLPNVSGDFKKINKSEPLVIGESFPDYWCRITNEGYTIFFSNPKSQNLQYPLKYGQAFCKDTVNCSIQVKLPSDRYKHVNLRFLPYQSLMLKIDNSGKLSFENIEFIPKSPETEK